MSLRSNNREVSEESKRRLCGVTEGNSNSSVLVPFYERSPLVVLPTMPTPRYQDLVDSNSPEGTLVNIYRYYLEKSAEYSVSDLNYSISRCRLSSKYNNGQKYKEHFLYLVCYTNDYDQLKSLLGSNLCIMLRQPVSKSTNYNPSIDKIDFINRWIKYFRNGYPGYRGSYVKSVNDSTIQSNRGLAQIYTIYSKRRYDQVIINLAYSRLNSNPVGLASLLDQMDSNMHQMNCNMYQTNGSVSYTESSKGSESNNNLNMNERLKIVV